MYVLYVPGIQVYGITLQDQSDELHWLMTTGSSFPRRSCMLYEVLHVDTYDSCSILRYRP
jgi:hypothetical protein